MNPKKELLWGLWVELHESCMRVRDLNPLTTSIPNVT